MSPAADYGVAVSHSHILKRKIFLQGGANLETIAALWGSPPRFGSHSQPLNPS